LLDEIATALTRARDAARGPIEARLISAAVVRLGGDGRIVDPARSGRVASMTPRLEHV
jgi:hypothetical protein